MSEQNWTDRDAAILHDEILETMRRLYALGFEVPQISETEMDAPTFTATQQMDGSYLWEITIRAKRP